MAPMLGEAGSGPTGRAPSPGSWARHAVDERASAAPMRHDGLMTELGQGHARLRCAASFVSGGMMVRLPEAGEQIRLAPIRALRAGFSGVGHLLLAADRL